MKLLENYFFKLGEGLFLFSFFFLGGGGGARGGDASEVVFRIIRKEQGQD